MTMINLLIKYHFQIIHLQILINIYYKITKLGIQIQLNLLMTIINSLIKYHFQIIHLQILINIFHKITKQRIQIQIKQLLF